MYSFIARDSNNFEENALPGLRKTRENFEENALHIKLGTD